MEQGIIQPELETFGRCPTREELKTYLESQGFMIILVNDPVFQIDGDNYECGSYAAESMTHVGDYMRDGKHAGAFIWMTEPYMKRIQNFNVVTTFKLRAKFF